MTGRAIRHAGMWGDFFIFSTINGLVWRHPRHSYTYWGLAVVAALIIAPIFHAIWGADKDLISHTWPTHESGNWLRDLGAAGWLHVAFMTWEIAVLAIYAFSPAPTRVVLIVAILLTLFWPLGAILPCRIVTGRWIDGLAITSSALPVGGTWVVSIFKLNAPS